MEILLFNPLPDDITVNRLEVLTITTRMYLIPEHAGELYISGVRVGEVI